MDVYSTKELNELAMKIILHAGDCRSLLDDAIKAIENGASDEEVDEMLKEARKKITEAHKVQTNVIQSTIMNDNQQLTMLFIHAQDTLMTINSELFLTTNMIKLHRLNNK